MSVPPNILAFEITVPHRGRTFKTYYRVMVHIDGRNTAVVIGAALGKAACHPDDTPDIRAGVPLALKRALKEVDGEYRKAFRRAFYQHFPQAHPHYKTCKEHPYPGYRWCVGCVTEGHGQPGIRAFLEPGAPPYDLQKPRPPISPRPEHQFDTGERGSRWPNTNPKGTTT